MMTKKEKNYVRYDDVPSEYGMIGQPTGYYAHLRPVRRGLWAWLKYVLGL